MNWLAACKVLLRNAIVVCLFAGLLGPQVWAQKNLDESEHDIERESKRERDSTDDEGSDVIAFVGVDPITLADVDFHLGRPAGEYERRPLAIGVRNRAVELLVKQRRALETMRKSDLAATREEVYLWIREHSQDSDAEQEVDSLVRQRAERAGVADATIVEQIAFRLSWQKYLAKHLTDSNLTKYFQAKPARFDGTAFDLDVVTLRVPLADSKKRNMATELLAEFRQGVLASDSLAFSKAAKAKGWRCERFDNVRLLGDIEPTIVDAVIDLDANSISGPTHTVDGVHLVRVDERREGDRELGQVRSEVRLHMILYLLNRLAAQSRNALPLKLTPAN